MQFSCPKLDVLAVPNTADAELRYRCREVFVLVHELVHPLSCDSKHLGDFPDAHRVEAHRVSVGID